MSHAYPHTLGTRLSAVQLSNVLRAANRSGKSPSRFARDLLVNLSDAMLGGVGDPDAAIAKIKQVLGLPPDVSAEDLGNAFQALLQEVAPYDEADTAPPDPESPSAEAGDPVPPKPGYGAPPVPPGKEPPAYASLSKYEIDACRKGGMSLSDYVASRDRNARRSALQVAVQSAPAPVKQLTREEQAGIKRLGITAEEFEARKANAVRRV